MEREAAVADPKVKLFDCPECRQSFETPEGLGAHLERHREVDPPAPPSPRGKPRSFECPKGCGRHFGRLTNEDARAHIPMCDGSAPLVAAIEERKEETVAKLECKWCGKKYLRGGSKFEKHEALCEQIGRSGESDGRGKSGGGVTTSEPAVIPIKAEESVKDQVLSMLTTLEEHYEGKLKETKLLIQAVEKAERPGQ